MPIDFRTVNTVWASVMVETLRRLGLTSVVVSPGSRSTPLTVAFAACDAIEAIPVLDERSAAFLALGLAKQSHLPVALVCTSGTAGANYFPALIEARKSRVPLIVLTTDRPPELRDCYSGQTIDQLRLFGDYPNWQAELAVPELALGQMRYLRQTILQAWWRSLHPVPGVVHLNQPFRDPLAPIPDGQTECFQAQFPPTFFDGLATWKPQPAIAELPITLSGRWNATPKGVIVAGQAQPHDPLEYCTAIAAVSQVLGWPVLAEGLSPLRNYASVNPHLVAHYDTILRNTTVAQTFAPTYILQIGPLPTSKVLRQWLADLDVEAWQVDGGDRNLDPLHNRTTPLTMTITQLAGALLRESDDLPRHLDRSEYLTRWLAADAQIGAAIDRVMMGCDRLCESKVSWLMSQLLPDNTPIFVANSTAVRDVEWFWRPGQLQVQPYVNRGANGIDGTLSTALGIAHRNRPAVMLTGDLALLHDTNGFLARSHVQVSLTILLLNNNGGGIFNLLPISKFDPPFEAFFATPQNTSFQYLCRTYGVSHERIADWQHLSDRLKTLPKSGIRVLELVTDRELDAKWRWQTFTQLAADLNPSF
ncbi:MAG: 2-succinyl-5-enolpyruvyl-6-hydroxy-3-cyclohexene-1-carboxylic-acid synthase [Synechococcus sp.]